MIRRVEGLLAKINGLSRWVKAGSAIVVAIVGVWAAGYKASAFFDGRYLQVKVLEQHEQKDARQFAETKLLFLESRQGQLEEQQFKLKVEKKKRPLTDLERERLDQIEKELDRLNKRIESEQKKATP